MYRRILLVVVLGLLISACVPYGGNGYYRTDVYTVDSYSYGGPRGGYYPYSRGYYVAPPPRYYVAPPPRYYGAPPPRHYRPPPGPIYRPGPPGPGYHAYPGRGPDPRWRGGPHRQYGHDRNGDGRPDRGRHR